MTVSPQDVQAKLDAATAALGKTTSSYQQMVKKYGSDTSKWPASSNWTIGLSGIAAARAEAGQLVVPPPGPPSPPTPVVVEFDGRASMMTALSESGAPPNVVQTQTWKDGRAVDQAAVQATLTKCWAALAFTKGDIALVNDPRFFARYGQLFKAAVATGDANPWGGSDPQHGAAELSARRPNDLGKTNYFWFGICVDAWNGPMSDLFFSEAFSGGYQTSSSSQFALGMKGGPDGTLWFSASGNAGYGNNPNGWAAGSASYNNPFLKVPFGVMNEFLVAITVAVDLTGHVSIDHRIPGDAWKNVYDQAVPTEFYGVASGNSFAQDGSNWPTVLDKIGLYFQEYGGESEAILHTGIVRDPSKDAVLATIPA